MEDSGGKNYTCNLKHVWDFNFFKKLRNVFLYRTVMVSLPSINSSSARIDLSK